MSVIDWFKKPFKKATTIKGRATRSEYWYFYLGYLLVYLGLFTLSALLNSTSLSVFSMLWSYIALVPLFSLSVRRLHDTNHSGFNLLWSFFPLLGQIYLLILFSTASDEGENEYGFLDDDKTQLPPTLFKKKEKEINFDFK